MGWPPVLLVLVFAGLVCTYPSGAPSEACSSLTPGHGGSPQSSPSPYTLDLSIFDLYNDGNSYYEPGNTYQLTLSGATFEGFLLQARLMVDDTTLVGLFSDPVSGTGLSSCSPANSGITHTSNSDKTSITGTWTAPPLGTGPIRFRFAVVQEFSMYWADIMSDVVYESGVNMLFDGGVLANNTQIVRGQVGEDEDGITCTSESVDCCSDAGTSIGWFSPSGDAVHEGLDGADTLYVTRGPGFVHLNRITGGTSALYWCDVPDYSGALQRFYVGLYSSSIISGAFETIRITFELETEVTVDPPQFSLTCRSEGGPATTVEWQRDGITIVDDIDHSSSQIVLDAVDAVYHNVLVVTGRNGGEYKCTVFSRTSISATIHVEVGTDPISLVALQLDHYATSIGVTWNLPSSPSPTGTGVIVLYETEGSSSNVTVGVCNECETTLSNLTTGMTYNISVITESVNLPSNTVGPVSVTLVRTVLELLPTSIMAELGSNVTLQCIVSGFPAPSVEWVHFNTLVSEREGIEIGEEIENSTVVSSTLHITNLRTEHYGPYHCRAYLSVTSGTANVAFTGVLNEAECEGVYNLTEPSDDLTVEHRGTVCFQCLSEDSEIQWTLDSEPISNYIGTISGQLLAVFAAGQIFRVNSSSVLQCTGDSTYTYNITLRELPPATVEITASGGTVAGQTLSLNCTVTTTEALTSPPLVEFLDVSGEPLVQQGIELGNPFMDGAVTTLTLEFSTLVTSHGGQYVCRATINGPQEMAVMTESDFNVTVMIPSPVVLVIPQNDSILPYAATNYSLVCKVDFNATYVNTGTAVMVEWTNSIGQLVTDSRITTSDTLTIVDGGYASTLTVSPLSLTDSGEFTCRATIQPDNTPAFVAASSPEEDTYTITVVVPPTPNLTLSVNGSGLAGEPLQLQCISLFIQGLFRPPTVVVFNQLGIEFDQNSVTVFEGRVESAVLLDPLLTSQSGVYTCVSTYNFPEVGLADPVLYSTSHNITVTVSIPLPHLVFGPLLNETYVGAVTYLYCTVQLGTAVDSAVQVNMSITRDNSDDSNQERNSDTVVELDNNQFQSSIVFMPLVHEDEDNYTCNVTVESNSESILATAVQGTYSLVPLDTPEPVVNITPDHPMTLGINASLTCMVTTVEGLLYPPVIDWQQLPDNSTVIIDDQMDDGNVFWRALHFNPVLEQHGGFYVCSTQLFFPNTSLPSLLTTQNYSLIVQAPVPDVMIMQNPNGPIIEGAPVYLKCTATVSSLNTLTFIIVIRWIDADRSELGNSSNGRIMISSTVENGHNEFQSTLTIAAVNVEQDSSYGCIAETFLEEPSEFVRTQPATSTHFLIIVGPPADFVVVSKTPTSISFSWGTPLTPAMITAYVLECNATLIGVDDPSPLNTTRQNATLLSLSPGVPYSCSLTALTDTNMPPPATVMATTFESAPTGPPRDFVVVSTDARSITCIWEAPEPHLQNGVILGYTVVCDPAPTGPLETVTESCNVTLTGFAPLTQYNCSVSASNSAGKGPLTYGSVVTGDDTTLFQLKVLGVQDCVSWKGRDEDIKLADITSAIVDNVNKRCDCAFTNDRIRDGVFLCFSSNTDSVTFRAELVGLADVNSTALVGHVKVWVVTGQTVLLQNVHFVLDSSCQNEVFIDDISSPECGERAVSDGESSPSLNTGAAAGITAAAILIVVVLVATVIALLVFLQRRHHTQVTLKRFKEIVSQSPQEKGNTILLNLHSARDSTISVDSDEMTFKESSIAINPQNLSQTAKNPLYASSSAEHSMAKSSALPKSSAPLPPLPTVFENHDEDDGYAVPHKLISEPSTTASPPSDYLTPIVSPTHTEKKEKPWDDSTIFTNRSSGVYDDPDRATMLECKSESSEVSNQSTKEYSGGESDKANT